MPKKFSISFAILLWVLVCILGFALVVALVIGRRLSNEVVEQETKDIRVSLESLESHIGSEISQRQATLKDLVNYPAISQGVLSPDDRRLEIVQFLTAIRISGRKDPLSLFDFSGELIHSTGGKENSDDAALWNQSLSPLMDDNAELSHVGLVGEGAQTVVRLAVPVMPEGLAEGVLLLEFPFAVLLQDYPLDFPVRISKGGSGAVIMNSAGWDRGAGEAVQQEAATPALLLESHTDYGELKAIRSEVLRGLFFAIAIPTILVGAGSIYLGHRLLARPLHQLSGRVDALHSEHPDGPKIDVVTSRLAEVESLATHFDAMVKEVADRTAELELSNRDLERFAYVAAHDLREPLRMISNYLDLVELEEGEKFSDEVQGYIDLCRSRCGHLMNMLDDLLQMASLRGGAELSPVDLGEVCADVCDRLEARIAETNASIEIGDLPEVVGNEAMLGLLFQNLISNAVKFTASGKAPLVSVSSLEVGEELIVQVTDQGIGFDSVYSEKIFEIFSRLQGRGKYSGSGIGLALCKRVVEIHGGRIWTESVVGEGSVFMFALPLKQPT